MCPQRPPRNEHGNDRDTNRFVFANSATLTSETTAEALGVAASGQMPVNLTFSNSSNSSDCCMPSPGTQAHSRYDISASARTSEQLHHNGPLVRGLSQYGAPDHNIAMATTLQPRGSLPDSLMQSCLMASVLDELDSGGHHHTESQPVHAGHSQFPSANHAMMQQESLPPVYRLFFPADESASLQAPQQLSLQQLKQLLPLELQGSHPPQPAHHRQRQYLTQQMSFHGLTNIQQPVGDIPSPQLPSNMQEWPSPVSQRRSRNSVAHGRPAYAAAHTHIQMDDLDLSGLKRDYSSFSGPTARPKQSKLAPRRALSFNQPSPAAAASAAAVTARRAQAGAGSSQAASNSRMSTAATNVSSPPDTDASISDSDDPSGSDSGGAGAKRRRIVKGKRGQIACLLHAAI